MGQIAPSKLFSMRVSIMDAARRLLAEGTYSAVTMEDIAKEAGVSYQTVYAVFGTKLRLAQAIIEVGWPHTDEARKLMDQTRLSTDPEVWLRMAARISRQIVEPCADLMRFMRESGDPTLRARYRGSRASGSATGKRDPNLVEKSELLGNPPLQIMRDPCVINILFKSGECSIHAIKGGHSLLQLGL